MDGAEITAARTAAASGVCIRRWASSGWRRAAVLGCGEQGRYHARMLAALQPDLTIRAYDPHPERIATLEGRVEAAASPLAAVAGADVVVTAAPIVEDPDPPIGLDVLGDRWLLLPIDFDALVRREAIAAADLFLVDDVEQFEYYRSLGHFGDWPSPAASVGEALARGDEAERVACVNLGIGALDAAFAARVLDAARARGVGVELPR
jgi:ornithine cyclodeaminase/alanine dehydrogenase